MRRAEMRSVPRHAASLRVLADGESRNASRTGSTPVTCSAKSLIAQVLLHQNGGERSKAPGIGPWPHAEMDVGHLAVSVITGSMTIIDRPGSLAIS